MLEFSDSKSKEFENLDLEYSINPDFIERIKNTTSFEFKDISYVDSDGNSVASPLFILDDLNKKTPITSETTINPELEMDKLLKTLNNLNSGDVLLLSLDMPRENQASTEVIETSETLTNTEFDSEDSKIEKTETLNLKKSKKIKNEDFSKDSFIEKIENIKNATGDNKTLLISEQLGEIYLPYKKSDLLNYIEKNPKTYKSLQDVVKKEFTLPFQFFKNQSSKLRFSETYNLLKNKDDQSFIKSVSYAFKIAAKKNLNPVIIASCQNKYELESYVYYLDSNNLNNFRFFDIIYEVNPLKK